MLETPRLWKRVAASAEVSDSARPTARKGARVELRREIETPGVPGGQAEAVQGSRAGDGTKAMPVREAQGAREGPSRANVVRALDVDVARLDEDLVSEPPGRPPARRAWTMETAPWMLAPASPYRESSREEASSLQEHVRDVEAGTAVAPAEQVQRTPARAQRAGGPALVTELACPSKRAHARWVRWT